MADDATKAGEPTDGDPTGDLGDAGKRALEAERKARRAAEQQLATLTGRVEALQRREAERIAGAPAAGFRPLAAADDLWRGNVQLDGLLDEHGAVDPTRVQAAVKDVLAERPHWAVQPPRAGSADGGRGSGPSEPNIGSIADSIIRGD
jgi:hypothetical protein